VYDFLQPMTLTREHERAIEVASQTFARQWGTLLSSRLGALTGVTLETIELHTYDEYIQSLPQTTTMIVLQVEPSRTPALLQIPTNASMTLIDCLLGGPAVTLEMPFREMTEIEWSLMKDMLNHTMGELAYGFAAIMPVQFEVRTPKYNPHFMQVVPASEPVLVIGFEMTIGTISTPITLMIVAETVMSQLRDQEDVAGRTDEEQREYAAAVELLSQRVFEVPLSVSVQFSGRTMGAKEITELEVGSVVPLHHPADRPLDVVVGDVVLGHAAIGVNGTRVACLVVSTEEEK
jgi:flagellar motor switch protein FliM